MDITSLTFILSILVTIFLTTGFIEERIGKVIDIAKLITKYADQDKALQKILDDAAESKKKARKAEIDEVGDSFELRISTLEMTLRCNITILFWSTFFYLLLILFSETGLYKLSNNQIFLSVLFVTLLPYTHKSVWHLFRKIAKDGRILDTEIGNKNLFTRYPIAFMWGVMSFQGLLFLADSSREIIQAFINKTVVTVIVTIAVCLLFYMMARWLVAINRAYTVVFFSKTTLKENLEETYLFTDIKTEKWAFIFSFITTCIASFLISHYLIFIKLADQNATPSGQELSGYVNGILVAILAITLFKVFFSVDRSSLIIYLQKCYRP